MLSVLNPIQAERSLDPIIKFWTTELSDLSGTNPHATAEVVVGEEPDLCRVVGKERIFQLCREVHRSDDPVGSARAQLMFQMFNGMYFAGRLHPFTVRVVYDLGLLVSKLSLTPRLSDIDPDGKCIFIRRSFMSRPSVEATLLHQMAHAAIGIFAHDETWIQEMARLHELGAPIYPGDLEATDMSAISDLNEGDFSCGPTLALWDPRARDVRRH